ncbi:calcium-binding protein [Phenylobacterium sp.]|uniref:calcium-binding protein n=1 Tax=Phenylobacterium sp. TaxID=1871053 RepID=UPI0035B440E8
MEAARLSVTPQGALDASTYSAGAFQIENLSTAGEQLTSVTVDLTGALLAGMVFDPAGQAGDTVAKGFTVDGQGGAFIITGATFGGGSDGAGYARLTLQLQGFDPGEWLRFSVDVDPASIRGVAAPGPGDTGSVAGVELTGAQVAFQFGARSASAELFKDASQGGAVAFATAGSALPEPTVTLSGVGARSASVSGAQQTVAVTGQPGGTVRLLVVEAGAFVQGVPASAPDLGPYEGNSALRVATYEVVLDATGRGQAQVTLTDSAPEGGLNLITAAALRPDGTAGPAAVPLAIALESGPNATLTARTADATLIGAGGSDSVTGVSGANYLRGGDGADLVQGGTGFDDAHGNAGNDTVRGGAGDDWVVGGKDDDLLSGDTGADIVYGNLGRDTCNGGDGADLIRGGQGDDSLIGGAGDDWLSGDRGADTVTGGAGADTFNGFAEAGLDRITDFNGLEGDRLRLEPGSAYTVAQVGADAVVSVGDARLVLVGVQASAIQPGWIFVG